MTKIWNSFWFPGTIDSIYLHPLNIYLWDSLEGTAYNTEIFTRN